MAISDTYGAELKRMTDQLEQVRALALPICMFCKKIRVDETYWEQVDAYFARHIDVAFTHGICPECLEERYGDVLSAEEAKERHRLRGAISGARSARGQQIPETDSAVRAAETPCRCPGAGHGTPAGRAAKARPTATAVSCGAWARSS